MTTRLWLLKKRVRCYTKLRRDFPERTCRWSWQQAGQVQRWSLRILNEIVLDEHARNVKLLAGRAA